MSISNATVEQVWTTFHTPLLHFVRRRVADVASAEDIVQDVFLKVHTHIGTLSDTTKLQSWLYQLARNAIVDHYRRTRVMVEVPDELPAFAQEDENDAVARLTPAVQAMVAALPAIYREALRLTEYEGLTQRELAERLGISVSGAKSRVQRARQMLRQMLLDCCHFELDRRNAIIRFQSRCACCTTNDCAPNCDCH
jgi:RNA polymerase sigma-70 factor (ECF subfamily)